MAPLNPETESMPSPPALKRPFPVENHVEGPATAAVSTLRTSSSSVSFLTIDEEDDDGTARQPPPPLTEATVVGNTVTPAPPPASYYDKGSVELAIETPVMMQRLEKRRRLTGTGANDGGDCLLIVLVGADSFEKNLLGILECFSSKLSHHSYIVPMLFSGRITSSRQVLHCTQASQLLLLERQSVQNLQRRKVS